MPRPKPVEPGQPIQSPSGVPQRAPEPVLGGGKPHVRTRAQELRGQLLACKRGILGMAIGRSRIEYHVLRGLGATPEEALCALLEAAYQDPPSLAFILAVNLPGNLRPDRLWGILQHYSIHPLSLALHLNDLRRALRVLDRLGVLDDYGRWLRPWGLDIHDEPDLRALPAGLVIDGDARIEDCPCLVDLGENLVVTGGTLLVRRCGALTLLPDGLSTDPSGHITLIDCPGVEHLGARTSMEGVLFVENCPRFKDQHRVRRHMLDEDNG